MPGRSRLRELARTALTLLPARLRARVLAAADRVGLNGADAHSVSVVVVAETGDRVEECLGAIRGQTHALLDVVVCPVGPASVGPLDDRRFRTIASRPTAYAAARAGIATAAGRYVVLVRACDRLLPGAIADLTGSLDVSGADLATGLLEQAGEAEPWLSRAQAEAHAQPGSRHPAPAALAADLTLANKAFTRELARRLDLTAHDDWLCSPALAALLPELTVDVLDRPVARFAPDRGHRAYGARPSPLPDLDHWLELDRRIRDEVAGTPWAAGWHRHWYDVVLPRFVIDAERADADTWRRLVALSRLPDDVEVRASSRGLLTLAGSGRRADVELLAAELETLGDDVPTELAGTRVLARWGSVDLTADDRRLADHETRLEVQVVRVKDTDEGRVVDLWTRIGGVDLADHRIELAVSADGTPTAVEPRLDRTADRWAGTRFQSAAEGAARVTVPRGSRELRVEARVGGLARSAYAALPTRTAPPDGSEPVVHGVFLDGQQLVVQLDRPTDGLRLRGTGTDVPGEPRRDGTVVFDTRRDLYGRQVALPTAVYHLHRPGGLATATAWHDALPVETVGPRHRLRVLPARDGGCELHLGPPRADDELGAYGRQRLRAAYAVDERPTRTDLWYFESFAGRSATDTPLAVFEEVRRRQPDLSLAWGILDHGHWAPSDARAVVIGSRDWYDVLGTARVLVTNTELEEWYRRRPDQLVVQCFHGYPSKAMGESQWLARDLPPRKIAVMRRRSVQTWDLISTPTPEMTAVYREQYDYSGPAAEHGYPRDDALRAEDAEKVRTRARRRLGVRPEQTAVLYAPTWRDHLAIRPRAAAMAAHLDVDAAAAALGDSHVILLRGHRFHTPGPSREGVVDVTDHPEVNELILASDVAVLDYSSLRFDYAQTRRPMVFLVPDLEDYTTGVRGFLFPFAETAPGPMVRTTEQVVAAVRDVPALTATWAARIADLDTRMNPYQDGKATARFVDALEEQGAFADGREPPGVR
jgi:CDP-glycerol glycerophosphotransferase (TagB/SpsB family)